MARTKSKSQIIIKLLGTNVDDLNSVISKLKEIADKSGVSLRGPIPLPTRRMKIRVRRSPCGQGRETYDTYELRVHKRLIMMEVNERVIHQLVRLQLPKTVELEMKIKS